MKMKDMIRRFFRRSAHGAHVAPRFVAHVNTRLVLRLSLERPGGGNDQHLIGGTLNISETGLAVLTPTLAAGADLITEGSELRVTLDIYPQGVVTMRCVVVRIERLEQDDEFNNILGLRITQMSHADRALYLEYIGTRGWESVLTGNDN